MLEIALEAFSMAVIRSFAGKAAERIWNEQHVRTIGHTMQRAVLRKLELIHPATDVEDLRIPPGNRLGTTGGRS